MSILIKGMEKPKSCTECIFEVIDTSGYPRCVIIQEMVVDGNLFNRCPLIEIPTPHGRLIDEDTFICRMDDSFRMAGLHGADYRKVKRWLKNAQTILEAEE